MTEGGAENIDEISGKCLGRPYPNCGGLPETRVIMAIEADSVRGMARASCSFEPGFFRAWATGSRCSKSPGMTTLISVGAKCA